MHDQNKCYLFVFELRVHRFRVRAFRLARVGDIFDFAVVIGCSINIGWTSEDADGGPGRLFSQHVVRMITPLAAQINDYVSL